ncbi:hypothetical protein GH714_031338 [Hevea brasiliensis]|uniref:Uncharacterized protein n=1 Tax=Hevea brasiliensis TaxID=3981 RepID=A0A6A6L155_HEVBR|nr:hypothetical protein GH714_031338 [Hevea brasiliensis]
MEEYTARKKEEAEKGLEARKAPEGQDGDYTEESQVRSTGREGGNKRPNQLRASARKSIRKPQKKNNKSIINGSSKGDAAYSVPLAKL